MKRLAGVAGSVLLLIGCGGPPATITPSPPVSDAAPSVQAASGAPTTPAALTTPTTPHAASSMAPTSALPIGAEEPLELEWRNRDGYQYLLSVHKGEVVLGGVDTLNAKPGEADVTVGLSASRGLLTNRLPDRNAPAQAGFTFFPVWQAGSLACPKPWKLYDLEGEVGTYKVFRAGQTPPIGLASRYCSPLGSPSIEAFGTIPAGGSIPVKGGESSNDMSIPEGDVTAFQAEFEKPVGWILGWSVVANGGEYFYPFDKIEGCIIKGQGVTFAIMSATFEIRGCEFAAPVRGQGSSKADLVAGGESRYDATYVARVTGADYLDRMLTVRFEAQGGPDLRRPETSCIEITGADGKKATVHPTKVDLTHSTPGAFKGSMVFSADLSGSYGFVWSCAGDYSVAQLGTVR